MKSSHLNYKYTVDQLADMLFDRMFKKWYSGNDPIFQNAEVHHNLKKHTKSFIMEKLNAGADVRTGYTGTNCRGVRNYYVFITGFAD